MWWDDIHYYITFLAREFLNSSLAFELCQAQRQLMFTHSFSLGKCVNSVDDGGGERIRNLNFGTPNNF